jgi:CheY-like chemotaxis protein
MEPPSAPSVLVLDDEPTIRKILSQLLKGAGFETLQAKDGIEGLSRLR